MGAPEDALGAPAAARGAPEALAEEGFSEDSEEALSGGPPEAGSRSREARRDSLAWCTAGSQARKAAKRAWESAGEMAWQRVTRAAAALRTSLDVLQRRDTASCRGETEQGMTVVFG